MLAVAGLLLHWHFSRKTETPVPTTVALSPATPRTLSPESSLPENPEPVPVPATEAPSADFTDWTARYLAAPPAERPAFIAEGIQLAEAHRTALADLIPRDPKRALESAVPMIVRQDLPPEIVDRLEERISAKGFFGVLGVVGQPAEAPAIRREVRLANQKRYEAHTYGTRLTQTTTPDANLTGIAIDGSLALSERGFRILEIGERLDPARPVFNTCPVSGKSSGAAPAGDGSFPPITQDTPAVEIAGEVH